MKLAMLAMVQRASDALDRVEQDIEAVKAGLVTITFADRPQDDAMIAVCRAAMLTELSGRKASLVRDLEAWGVQAD